MERRTMIPLVTRVPVVEERFEWTSAKLQDTFQWAEMSLGNNKKAHCCIHKDLKGHMWDLMYGKDGANRTVFGLMVHLPVRLMTQERGLTPVAMRLNILIKKAGTPFPDQSIRDQLICIKPGGSHVWNFGSIADHLKKVEGGRLTVEVWLKHLDYSSVMKEVDEDAEKNAINAMKMTRKLDVLSSFGDLLEDGDSSDFEMKVEGKVFHLHKAILSVMSPAFKKLFLEGEPDSVIAEKMSGGLSRQTVEVLVNFLYTGKLTLTAMVPEDCIEAFKELLRSIRKWEVPRLAKLVDRKIASYATVQSAERLYELACAHKFHFGGAHIAVFIAKNRKEIFALRRKRRIGETNFDSE